MTNYNERLDKALSNLYNSAWVEGSNYEENNPEGSDIPSKREIAKTAATKQAILDWHNKQVEALLDRLIAQQWSFGNDDDALAVPTRYIEAERNKLNNSDGDAK